MTKREYLEKFGCIDSAGEVHCHPEELYLPMNHYAKEQAIAFDEWMVDTANEYARTGLNRWTHHKTLESISTDQLYALFLEHLNKQV